MLPPLIRLWTGAGGPLRFSRRLIAAAAVHSPLLGMRAAFSTAGPLVFVTGNRDKLKDARHVLGPARLVESHDADLIEIQGEPIAIARHKCLEALRLQHERDPQAMVVIEDTALCMNALGGMPGPFIKWFQQHLAPADLHRMLSAFDDRRAQFVSTVAVGSNTSEGAPQIRIFQSVTHGEIVAPRGTNGDRGGWDPCFQPVGSDKTLGEMEEEERSLYCARVQALRQLRSAFFDD